MYKYFVNEGMEFFVSCFRKIGVVKTMESLLEKLNIINIVFYDNISNVIRKWFLIKCFIGSKVLLNYINV